MCCKRLVAFWGEIHVISGPIGLSFSVIPDNTSAAPPEALHLGENHTRNPTPGSRIGTAGVIVRRKAVRGAQETLVEAIHGER
jgi:hypothetical protein